MRGEKGLHQDDLAIEGGVAAMQTLPEISREVAAGTDDAPGTDDIFPSIKGAWAAILFYGGIPTFTVYPLGLATLYLYQKAIRTYNHTDAWYAVSLIPKTTVLGVGAEVLFKSLSYTMVSGFAAMALLVSYLVLHDYYLVIRNNLEEEKDPASEAVVAGTLRRRIAEAERRALAVIVFIAFVLVVLIVTGPIVLGNIGAVWLPSLCLGLWGGWLLAKDHGKKQSLERAALAQGTKTTVRHRRWLLRGLGIIYVGALLSAVLAAALPEANPDYVYQTVDLKLPKAVLDTGTQDKCTVEEPCPLLSHSDGYWNIITPQENDILSIPDDEVTDSKVRILLGN